MSASPGTCWAKNLGKVKAASNSTVVIAETFHGAAVSVQKKSLVLKGMANGTMNENTATHNGKKTDWADSEDDDEFLKSFDDKANSRLVVLQDSLIVKDARIGELEATVGVKDMRIEELEAALGETKRNNVHFEDNVASKDTRIKILEQESTTKSLQVQELVAEVDTKDRRIMILETELDKKGTIIRDLEMKQNNVATERLMPQQPTGTKKDSTNNTPIPDHEDKEWVNIKSAGSKASFRNATSSTVSGSAHEQSKGSASSTSPQTSSTPKNTSAFQQAGPAVGTSKSPTFLTQESLRVVPPAPAPKKLSFPIDFSKYGKKATLPTVKVVEPPIVKAGPVPTWGAAAKQARTESAAVPPIEPSKDIRHMEHDRRMAYGNGPLIALSMGHVKLGTVPKYMFMQCSGKAYRYFTEHPDATSITFSTGSMDVDSAKAHITWMDEMTYQGRVYSITLNTDPKFDTKNLNICRAARVLGLNNTYVGHFTKQLCDRVRKQYVTPEFLHMVCALVYPENDPIFDCLANNLVNQRARNTLADPKLLAELIAQHLFLGEEIDKIEKRMAGARQSSRPLAGGEHGRADSGRKGANSSLKTNGGTNSRVGHGEKVAIIR